MSSHTAESSKKSWLGKLLTRIGLVVLIAVAAYFFVVPYAISYIYPKKDEGVRMVTENMDNIVVEHSGQVENETFAQPDRYHDNGRINLHKVDILGSEAAKQVAEAVLLREEKIAEAKGELLKPKGVWLPGSQATWMPTSIPIYSCMHITTAGQVTRGVYGKAGPEGINFETITIQEREGFVSLNSDRKTLVPGVPWGAILGQACEDNGRCGPAVPLKREVFVSPQQIGGGHLSVITNGFVSGQTSAGMLVGIRQLNMSDYNIYGGGFRIDWEKAPDNMCEQSNTQIARR